MDNKKTKYEEAITAGIAPAVEEGCIKPLLLSELVEQGQETIKKHGDMLVWVETSEPGYDDTIRQDAPAAFMGAFHRNVDKWWGSGFQCERIFMITGM